MYRALPFLISRWQLPKLHRSPVASERRPGSAADQNSVTRTNRSAPDRSLFVLQGLCQTWIFFIYLHFLGWPNCYSSEPKLSTFPLQIPWWQLIACVIIRTSILPLSILFTSWILLDFTVILCGADNPSVLAVIMKKITAALSSVSASTPSSPCLRPHKSTLLLPRMNHFNSVVLLDIWCLAFLHQYLQWLLLLLLLFFVLIINKNEKGVKYKPRSM